MYSDDLREVPLCAVVAYGGVELECSAYAILRQAREELVKVPSNVSRNRKGFVNEDGAFISVGDREDALLQRGH